MLSVLFQNVVKFCRTCIDSSQLRAATTLLLFSTWVNVLLLASAWLRGYVLPQVPQVLHITAIGAVQIPCNLRPESAMQTVQSPELNSDWTARKCIGFSYFSFPWLKPSLQNFQVSFLLFQL